MTPDDKFDDYFGNFHDAAEALTLGQAYESVSQDKVHKIMDESWIR